MNKLPNVLIILLVCFHKSCQCLDGDQSEIHVGNPSNRDTCHGEVTEHDTDVFCQQSLHQEIEVGDENMALMLYTPTYLTEFRQKTKMFSFAGRTITIQQHWDELGVAAVVWDAAVVLAEYLEKSVNEAALILSGKLVVELGAGTGLVGIVAALLGGDVTTTDRQIALDQLRTNIRENLPETGGSGGIALTVKELSWGENLEEFPRPFDVIIGADIVYIEDTFPKLLATMVHLSHKDTLVLLSCRIRYARDEKFLEMLREQFSVREILHDVDRGIHVFQAQLL